MPSSNYIIDRKVSTVCNRLVRSALALTGKKILLLQVLRQNNMKFTIITKPFVLFDFYDDRTSNTLISPRYIDDNIRYTFQIPFLYLLLTIYYSFQRDTGTGCSCTAASKACQASLTKWHSSLSLSFQSPNPYLLRYWLLISILLLSKRNPKRKWSVSQDTFLLIAISGCLLASKHRIGLARCTILRFFGIPLGSMAIFNMNILGSRWRNSSICLKWNKLIVFFLAHTRLSLQDKFCCRNYEQSKRCLNSAWVYDIHDEVYSCLFMDFVYRTISLPHQLN